MRFSIKPTLSEPSGYRASRACSALTGACSALVRAVVLTSVAGTVAGVQAFDLEEEIAQELALDLAHSGDYKAEFLAEMGQPAATVLSALDVHSPPVNLNIEVRTALKEMGSQGLPVGLGIDSLSPQQRSGVAFPNLRASTDPLMQDALDQMVRDPKIARAVAEGRFAAALVDVTNPLAPAMASINGDLMMYAASLPKIAILLGAFEKAAASKRPLDAQALETLTDMIRVSSNSAATEMYNTVGPEQLAAILQSPKYKLYDSKANGGLWVGKPYAKQDTWMRDPLNNISHGATALQVARFFYLLETGRLVDLDSSRKMKEMLGQPAIAHKFVKGLKTHQPSSRIFRKSGTWRTYHADGGIVERNGRTYIAVMMANDVRGGSWLSDLIVDFDGVIHARDRRFALSSAN